MKGKVLLLAAGVLLAGAVGWYGGRFLGGRAPIAAAGSQAQPGRLTLVLAGPTEVCWGQTVEYECRVENGTASSALMDLRLNPVVNPSLTVTEAHGRAVQDVDGIYAKLWLPERNDYGNLPPGQFVGARFVISFGGRNARRRPTARLTLQLRYVAAWQGDPREYGLRGWTGSLASNPLDVVVRRPTGWTRVLAKIRHCFRAGE